MIPKAAKMRVARPTDNLSDITQMYVNGLGFDLLGEFVGHIDMSQYYTTP